MKKLLWCVICLCLVLTSGCVSTDENPIEAVNISSTVTPNEIAIEEASTDEGEGAETNVPATPDPPIDVIQIAWFYKPPEDLTQHSMLHEHFDLFILTKNDENERDQILKASDNEDGIPQYFRFEAIYQPENCIETPFNNQVAYQPGDFCNILEDHADWFLKDVQGNLIQTSNSPYVHMDPGHSGWQSFALQRMRQTQEEMGWQGVFLDNVDASLNRTHHDDILNMQYSTDQAFQGAVTEFLKTLYHGYFMPSGRPLYANILYLKDTDVWFQYLQYLDGAMIENFAADWDYDYLDVEDWEEHLWLAEKTQEMDKEIILVTQGDRNDFQRVSFTFGSYLLIQQGKASFRYSNDEHYREVWLFNEYEIDIGQPLGKRYKEDGLWKREFTGGSIEVNPETHIAQFDLD